MTSPKPGKRLLATLGLAGLMATAGFVASSGHDAQTLAGRGHRVVDQPAADQPAPDETGATQPPAPTPPTGPGQPTRFPAPQPAPEPPTPHPGQHPDQGGFQW